MNPTNQTNQLDEAKLIAKAIGYTENGGKPDLANPSAGKSGELKSIYQFEPGTWDKDSEEVFGKKDVPLNNDTETYVVTQTVAKDLEDGKTPPQIFSMWNAGDGEPDAYTGKFSNGQSSVGRNKDGVAFNVPAYVKTAMNYYNQFSQGGATPADTDSDSLASAGGQPPQGGSTVTPEQYQGAITTIMGLVKKGQGTPSGSQPNAQPGTATPQTGAQQPQVGLLPGLLQPSSNQSS